MLKVKKIFSAFVGMAMTVNALMTMPIPAFADEETSHTYTYDGYEVSYDVTNAWVLFLLNGWWLWSCSGQFYALSDKRRKRIRLSGVTQCQSDLGRFIQLGMTDPKNELIFERIYESKIADYKSYFFNQVYNGIPVYGHSVTVVARTNGEIVY